MNSARRSIAASHRNSSLSRPASIANFFPVRGTICNSTREIQRMVEPYRQLLVEAKVLWDLMGYLISCGGDEAGGGPEQGQRLHDRDLDGAA